MFLFSGIAFCKGILPPASDTLPGRKVNIRIEIGSGMAPLKTSEYLRFIGEATDTLGQVLLIDRERILPINGIFSQRIIDAMVAFSIWKELYAGLFYKTDKIIGLRRGDNGGLFKEDAFFIGVGALIGYDFYPIKSHRNFAAGFQTGMGSYHGPQFYSGRGRQLMIHSEGYVRYAFKDRYGLKAYFGHDYFLYKEKGFSEAFQEATIKKVALNNFYLGLGLFFKLHIRPEKEKM
jgi:hypothetical protein